METRKNPRIIALIILSSVALLLLIGVLTGCSCEEKISRIKKRCPELVQKDTIRFKDTIYTKLVEKDTVFNYLQKDTVVIKKENMTLKYYYNIHDSTVYLSGKCDTIKIIKEYAVPVEKLVYKENFWSWMKDWGWVLLVAVAILIIINFFKK